MHQWSSQLGTTVLCVLGIVDLRVLNLFRFSFILFLGFIALNILIRAWESSVLWADLVFSVFLSNFINFDQERIWDKLQIIDSFLDSVMSVCLTKTEIIAGSVDGTVRTFDIRIGRYVSFKMVIRILVWVLIFMFMLFFSTSAPGINFAYPGSYYIS